MVAEFPRTEEAELAPLAEADMDLIMSVIGAVRNLRSELNVPPAKKVDVVLLSGREEARRILNENRIYVANLARTGTITFQPDGEKPRGSATAIVGDVEVFLPLKGVVNFDDEEKRIQKELSKINEELSRIHRKLHNQDFLEKAKPEAVEKEREKVSAFAERESKLKESLARVQEWKANG
jgi:valyl-tRNA synthetase